MSMAFDAIVVERSTGKVVVALFGEADLAATEPLDRLLGDELRRGARQVTVDCSGLGFLDASGIGVLVDFSRRVRNDGGRFELRDVPANVLRVLHLAGAADLAEPADQPDG